MTEVERKIALTRFLREENAMNRMKMKNREEILYGSGKTSFGGREELPLVYDGYLGEEDFGLTQPSEHHSTLGLRMALAILLFSAVLYLDKTGASFNGQPVSAMISSQVDISMEGKLADFISRFETD